MFGRLKRSYKPGSAVEAYMPLAEYGMAFTCALAQYKIIPEGYYDQVDIGPSEDNPSVLRISLRRDQTKDRVEVIKSLDELMLPIASVLVHDAKVLKPGNFRDHKLESVFDEGTMVGIKFTAVAAK